MTPRYFEFYSPMKILSGDHALRQIPFELRRLGVRRLMVLAGGTARRARYFKELFADLEENGIAVGALVEEVPVDSSLDFVNQCGLLYQEKAVSGSTSSIKVFALRSSSPASCTIFPESFTFFGNVN